MNQEWNKNLILDKNLAERCNMIKSVDIMVGVLCKGCGVCAAACPQHAITMRHFTDGQVQAQIVTAFQR